MIETTLKELGISQIVRLFHRKKSWKKKTEYKKSQ